MAECLALVVCALHLGICWLLDGVFGSHGIRAGLLFLSCWWLSCECWERIQIEVSADTDV
jgi:hypothetical protein